MPSYTRQPKAQKDGDGDRELQAEDLKRYMGVSGTGLAYGWCSVKVT